MTHHRSKARQAAALAAVAGFLAAAGPAHAQGDGFLFRAPQASLTLRAGMAAASARSDIFAESTDLLTLGRGDFGGFALGADLAIARAPESRLDLVLGVGYASSSTPSEFRDWVDQDDQSIVQTTTFRRLPVTFGVKAYVLPRGRAIGSLAWVPARVAPYVGAGLGATWYSFRQEGDFVDFDTDDIFTDTFETSGWGPTAQASAGLDVTLSPRLALTLDARYVHATAGTGQDFDGFDDIDLSGPAVTAGITLRF